MWFKPAKSFRDTRNQFDYLDQQYENPFGIPDDETYTDQLDIQIQKYNTEKNVGNRERILPVKSEEFATKS